MCVWLATPEACCVADGLADVGIGGLDGPCAVMCGFAE